MDPEKDKFFGLCKCCQKDGCFRSLWVEYNEAGLLRNYGEMLNECFSLQWQKPDNDHLEQICDNCVQRVSNAYRFRQQMLLSQDRRTGSKPDEKDDILDSASGDEITLIVEDSDAVTEHEAAGVYVDVEYLEEEATKVELVDDPVNTNKAPIKRKRKKHGRRLYKNYTIDEMIQCLEAVKSGAMTVPEASAFYGVSRKIVAAKLLSVKQNKLVVRKPKKNESMMNEVKTLLTYTNATPFKTRAALYHCAYCPPNAPLFEDPDELRTHTSTQHADERTKKVYDMLRPLWLNEILRVDIENLHCTVCSTALVSWNDMFKHFKEKHDLDFDQAYSRVIPYTLTSELRCALCKETFPSYSFLDFHMNAHYNSYVCSECSDTFMSVNRLRNHLRIHESGRYVCGECGKVFTLDKYRRKHIRLVHKQAHNFPCRYCQEKFAGEYSRHQHVLECHREKVKTITCEHCDKVFDWRPHYVYHVRTKHKKEL